MKVFLDIKESKAKLFMEFLYSISYVKAKPLSPYKSQILEELKEAVENMTLVKAGKLKPRPAKELLDEI